MIEEESTEVRFSFWLVFEIKSSKVNFEERENQIFFIDEYKLKLKVLR